MLPEPLQLGKVDATQIFDYLYDFFHRDFVQNKAYLNQQIYIDPKSRCKDDGKEMCFWHITTKETKKQVRDGSKWHWKVVDRYIDYRRAERIEWIKLIIENHNHDKVKWFYHKETKGKKPIRLYLWAYQDDFVVILQKLGRSSSFLVTSFYIDHAGKRREYQKRFDVFSSNECEVLRQCHWF
ncbi:MAG: RlfB protein [Methylomarinum sp.]|nr:RlfB protein [Methylomarinum sp.]